MKRYFSFLCILLILSGCSSAEIPPEPTSAAEQPASTDTLNPTEVTTASATEAVSHLPYTMQIDAFVPVFDGPGYDNVYVQIIGQDGIYTITEEISDDDGNLWGCLKSGVGWVDLTYAEAILNDKPLISAGLADDTMLNKGHHEYAMEDSEYTQNIAFHVSEAVTDVKFSSMVLTDSGIEPDKTLYELDTLSPDSLLITSVVFYGDMTSYAISFTDAAGNSHSYIAYISGRNGALILDKYE